MSGRLTTHVLDTSAGRPAIGVVLSLARAGDPRVLAERITNADGRVDGAILEGEDFKAGTYELSFRIGDYYRSAGVKLAEPAFLDIVVIRFGLGDEGHYHVPLLVSPYGYSTYRGS